MTLQATSGPLSPLAAAAASYLATISVLRLSARPFGSRQTPMLLLAALAPAGPLLLLAVLARHGLQPQAVEAACAAAAMTYLLLAVPALSPGRLRPAGQEDLWSTCTVPCVLAAAALWLLCLADARLSRLDGQFFITIFALSMWLHQDRLRLQSGRTTGPNERPNAHLNPIAPSCPTPQTGPARLLAPSLGTLLALAALLVLTARSGLTELYGALAGAGIAIGTGLATRATPPGSDAYGRLILCLATMAACTLAPALSMLLEPTNTAASRYVVDGAVLMLAALFWLPLRSEGTAAGRWLPLTASGIWTAWLIWFIWTALWHKG